MKIENPFTTQNLIDAGFKEPSPAIDGVALTKSLKAWDMPYVRAHIIGDEGVTEDSEVIVRVNTDSTVQLTIPCADYCEEPLPIDGYGHAVLIDAGVKP